MAVSVCGRSSLWPFRFVAISVCGRFGLWPFRFVAVSVCGRFGLWPFRFVAVMTCYPLNHAHMYQVMTAAKLCRHLENMNMMLNRQLVVSSY